MIEQRKPVEVIPKRIHNVQAKQNIDLKMSEGCTLETSAIGGG